MFLVFLILLSYPIIRITGLASGDMLRKTYVSQVGVSFILVSLLFGLAASYIFSTSKLKKINNTHIKRLITDVEKYHAKEINQYYKLLSNDTLTKIPDSLKKYCNEIIEISNEGVITGFAIKRELFKGSFESFLNLGKRDYFKNAETEKVHISSHYSYTSGKREGVISRKIYTNTTKAITYNFDSLDNEVFNKTGLRYLLIKPRGEVYYQSPEIKTVIPTVETGVGSKQWEEVKSLIQNNQDDTIGIETFINLNGKSYRAVLHKMKFEKGSLIFKEPIWIMALKQPDIRYLRSFLVMINTTSGLIIFLSVLIALFIIANYSSDSSLYLYTKDNLHAWFRPTVKKQSAYLVLLLIIVLHIVALPIIFLISDGSNFISTALLCSEFMAFITLCKYLLLSKYREKLVNGILKRTEKIYVLTVCLITLLLIALTLYTHYKIGCFSLTHILPLAIVYVFHAIVISIALIISYYGKGLRDFYTYKMYSKLKNISSLNSKKLYAYTFTAWIIAIGMLPGFFIHQSASNYDINLWEAVKPKIEEDKNLKVTNIDKLLSCIKNEIIELLREVSDNKEVNTKNYNRGFAKHYGFQRRKFFKNYTDIKNPTVDNYLYASNINLIDAFSSKLYKDYSYNWVWHMLFSAVSVVLMFFLVKYITKKYL